MDKWYNVLRGKVESDLRDEMDKAGHETLLNYFSLNYPKSCLDGDFTAEELRMIADAMEELKSKTEKA